MDRLRSAAHATIASATVTATDYGLGSFVRTNVAYSSDQRQAEIAANARKELSFLPWKVTSRQKRLGEENDYRRIIYANPTLAITDDAVALSCRIRAQLSALRVPYVYSKYSPDLLAETVLLLHDQNILRSTLVAMDTGHDIFLRLINRMISTRDYTLDPNVNFRAGIYRREQPLVTTNLDISKNIISLVSFDDVWSAITNGEYFHFQAFIIFVDIEPFQYSNQIRDGAKYISSHVAFITTDDNTEAFDSDNEL